MLQYIDCNQVLKAAGGFQVEINNSETMESVRTSTQQKWRHLIDLWANFFLNSEVSQAKTIPPQIQLHCATSTQPSAQLYSFHLNRHQTYLRIESILTFVTLCCLYAGLWFSLIPYLISQESQFTLISTYGPSSRYLETMVTVNISEQPLAFLSQTTLPQSFLAVQTVCE